MIVNAPVWIGAIVQSFQQIGGQAAGISGLSPSSAFNSGLALFQIMYRGFGSLGWFHLTIAALIALIAGLIMFLSFALIAGQMLLAICEAYIGVGGGMLLLGFSGSRWTIRFAEGFLGWLVGVGIKLFFLYLMVGVGLTITAGWNTALVGWTTGDPTLPLTIAGGSLIFMLVAWSIPNTAASVVGGAVSLNLSHAFEAAMAGYGLGRILGGQAGVATTLPSSSPQTSLDSSLDTGERAALASRSSTAPTQKSLQENPNSAPSSITNATPLNRDSRTNRISQNGQSSTTSTFAGKPSATQPISDSPAPANFDSPMCP
jgi:type IV secretion system protein TrbL